MKQVSNTMKVIHDKEIDVCYLVIKIGDKTFSTKFEDIWGGNIDISRIQITDTKGIGLQKNMWVKGILTEKEKHETLKEPIPFEINIYAQLTDKELGKIKLKEVKQNGNFK